MLAGKPFHGEFSSADATALSEENARFTLYGNQGSTVKTAITLASNEQVVITDIYVSVATGTPLVQIFDGSNNSPAAGEKIFEAKMADNTNGNIAPRERVALVTPHYCLQGTYPKCKADSAVQVYAIIRGVIIKN